MVCQTVIEKKNILTVPLKESPQIGNFIIQAQNMEDAE